MSDTVYVLDQVGIRLVKEKTLISDTQLKRPEQVVGFVSDILREYDREVMFRCTLCIDNSAKGAIIKSTYEQSFICSMKNVQ